MEVSRRGFTAGLTAALAGLAVRPGWTAAREPSVVAGLEIGVQSYSFRAFDLDRMIAAMQSIGLTSVELWNGHLDPLEASEADFKATRKKLNDAGIEVSAYCANFPTDATDEHLDRAFEGALLLGTRTMTSSVEKPLLPRLDAWCRKFKIHLGLHNHWLGDSWFHGDKSLNFEGPDDFAEALKGRSEYLCINLDIGHFFAAGHDPVAYFREHHDRIVSLHVKDRDEDPEHSYRRFGEGATPIAAVLRLARDVHFPYAANIEWEIEEQNPTPGVRQAYAYIRKVLA
jgi:sugar phosphate isomerase/epimerase